MGLPAPAGGRGGAGGEAGEEGDPGESPQLTNYQRGRQFEYRSRDKALKLGAVYVMRAASSKGAADLIVLWPRTKRFVFEVDATYRVLKPAWLVQCKRDGRLPKAEREELLRLGEETGARPVLARVPKSGRGVEFIDLTTQEAIVG